MQALQPAEETWSYQWDYTMGAPDTALWDYPIGGGPASFEGNEGLYFGMSSNAYAGLCFKDYAAWLGQKAVYEVEVKVISTFGNGFRIVCVSGSNGVPDNCGLQVTINSGYLNVVHGGDLLSSITKDATIAYNEWHKVRLELNTGSNENKVYLDDELIDTVTNANLSVQYATNVWCLMQLGEAYVKSVRYRKED